MVPEPLFNSNRHVSLQQRQHSGRSWRSRRSRRRGALHLARFALLLASPNAHLHARCVRLHHGAAHLPVASPETRGKPGHLTVAASHLTITANLPVVLRCIFDVEGNCPPTVSLSIFFLPVLLF